MGHHWVLWVWAWVCRYLVGAPPACLQMPACLPCLGAVLECHHRACLPPAWEGGSPAWVGCLPAVPACVACACCTCGSFHLPAAPASAGWVQVHRLPGCLLLWMPALVPPFSACLRFWVVLPTCTCLPFLRVLPPAPFCLGSAVSAGLPPAPAAAVLDLLGSACRTCLPAARWMRLDACS